MIVDALRNDRIRWSISGCNVDFNRFVCHGLQREIKRTSQIGVTNISAHFPVLARLEVHVSGVESVLVDDAEKIVFVVRRFRIKVNVDAIIFWLADKFDESHDFC
jgi:hypothetical protein